MDVGEGQAVVRDGCIRPCPNGKLLFGISHSGSGESLPCVEAPDGLVERAEARLSTFGPFHGSATCLEEMRARSPPRRSQLQEGPCSVAIAEHAEPDSSGGAGTAAASVDSPTAAAAREYNEWLSKHPSALDNFKGLVELVGGRRLAMFLDYDGTLSPIVADPERAFMPDGMRTVVKEVASLFPTAIVSGRGREKVYNFVQLSELYYAGSHGMDIMLPLDSSGWHARKSSSLGQQQLPSAQPRGAGEGAGGTVQAGGEGREEQVGGPQTEDSYETARCSLHGHEVVLFQPAKKFAPVMTKVYEELAERAKAVEGSLVENNNFCITIHFRRVREELWDRLADIVEDVVSKEPLLRTTHGRKVLEIRPTLDWDKGKAVSYLLTALGLSDPTGVMPLYIGDDRTDEDAFEVLKDRGSGCGIVVTTSAKPTAASFSLRDPNEVRQFLQNLVDWKRGLSAARVAGAERP